MDTNKNTESPEDSKDANQLLTNSSQKGEMLVAYAGFWRRFVGLFIDGLILTILFYWCSLPFYSATRSQVLSFLAQNSFPSFFSLQFFLSLVIGFFINFLIVALYYCFFEASRFQATPGKYVVGIWVTDLENRRITYKRAFLRRVFGILSILTLFIGFIISAFTSKKQTLHDKLAKTVVIIKHKRGGWVLVSIFFFTLILGILSDYYLGAGFHISFNSPTTSFNTQTGLQSFIVEKGDQIDPKLKKAIIDAFMANKSTYTSEDPAAIRQHFTIAIPPAQSQEALKMSDSDLKNMAIFFNQLASYTTLDLLNSPETVWTFNADRTAVQISFTAIINGTPTTVRLNMLYYNGQWWW